MSTTRSWSRQPTDLDQRLVRTPYGKGLVVATRSLASTEDEAATGTVKHKHETLALQSRNDILAAIQFTRTHRNENSKYMQLVELVDWDISSNVGISKFPKLYTTSYLPSVRPVISEDIICTYGRGTITQIVPRNYAAQAPSGVEGDTTTPVKPHETYVVQLKSWRLASRSAVTCYLSRSDIHIVRKKTLYEMDVYERVEAANEVKQLANKYFSNKDYEQALEKYATAVDSVRYVQHDANSTNYVRADLVDVMITCCNNASTCCAKLTRWVECERFAKNALLLIDALHEKRGMKIHTILNQAGITDMKMFGEWKAKSLILISRSHAERKGYSEAISVLKQAREVISTQQDLVEVGTEGHESTGTPHTSTALQSQEKEVKRLLTLCLRHSKAEKQKEKLRAQAMFGGHTASTSSPTASKKKKEMTATLQENAAAGATPVVSAASVHSGSKENGKKVVMENNKEEEYANKSNGSQKPSRMENRNDVDRINGSRGTKGMKRVSFHETVEKKSSDVSIVDGSASKEPENEEEEEEEEVEESWLDEHKEAFILAGVGGLLALSFIFLRGKSHRS